MSMRSVATLAALGLALAGCAGEPVSKAPPLPPAPPEKPMPAPFTAIHTAVLDCDELAPVGVLVNETTARIDAPREPLDMPKVESASGALFEGNGHRLWFRGDTATWRQPGEDAGHECRVITAADAWESARLRGVAFRAEGRDPGWLFELVQDKWLLVISDDGRNRFVAPPVIPASFGDGQRFSARSGSHSLELLSLPVPCRDDGSQVEGGSQATLLVDGVTMRGCGRWLAP